MYQAKHHTDASAELVQLSGVGMRGLVDLFAAGQRSGDLRTDQSPQEQALVAFAAVHGVATLATDDLLDGVPSQTAARLTLEFLWRGVTASPRGAP
ncbi:hypothetical protein [Leifsonia sp. AG29]|uniref:hypothetical protein n=1 Tax=Leifsonia sp. AG29 TaxID=2598860 RepID=UPI00131CB80D|nr:hypothetical protein [Leifsonia sp. AG29]